MSELSDIHDGIKTVVEAYYSGFDFVVYSQPPKGEKEYPCLVIYPTGDLDYIRTVGADDVRFLTGCRLYLHIQDNVELEEEMDAYRSMTGTKSLRAAIKSDVTLNASCTYAEVVRSSQPERGFDNEDNFWENSSLFEIDIIKN